jgi:putative ABC transport system substrate-binding protein
MKRREFITLTAGAAATWPLAARAQSAKTMRRVGFLSGRARPEAFENDAHGGFLRGMRELGFVEGTDFEMEWRFAAGKFERLPELAAELVRSNVNVIVSSPAAASLAASKATSTIPIVFVYVSNPVALGLVASLAKPGGNVTGLSVQLTDAAPKWVQLLSEVGTDLRRVAVLANPSNPGSVALVKSVHAAVEQAHMVLEPLEASNAQQLDDVFASIGTDGARGLIVMPDPFFASQQARIAALALKHRLPSMFGDPGFVEAGGLASYGDPLASFMKRAAFYVERIFKGANPSELPVQQPTRFAFAVNLKTAAALGLTIPPTLLVLADQVIE